MNSIRTTKVFEPVNKIFKLQESILNPSFSLDPYIVDYEMYDFILKTFRGYKFPLAKKIVEYGQSQMLIPLTLSDPKVSKAKIIMHPSSIPTFLKINNKKQSISYVDTSPKASYLRNKVTGGIEYYKIDERCFFAYMQMALLNKIFTDYSSTFEHNVNFAKLVAEIYAYLLQRSISSIYPVTSSVEDAEALMYLCAIYCLQNFFNYSIEKAKANALTLRGVNRLTIVNNCHYYNYAEDDNIDMRPELEHKGLGDGKTKIYPIDIFVNILSAEFPYIKSGRMEARTLLERYSTMYGQNSAFAVEHFFSFINMIFTSDLKVNLYTDLLIQKAAETYTEDLHKMVLQLVP